MANMRFFKQKLFPTAYPLFMILALASLSSFTTAARAAPPVDSTATSTELNPNGQWNLVFQPGQNNAVNAATIYSPEANVSGGIVYGTPINLTLSHYSTKDIGLFYPISDLYITMQTATRSTGESSATIQLTGGPSTLPRTLILPQNPRIPVAANIGPEFLAAEREVSPGCRQHEGYREFIKFNSNDSLTYSTLHYLTFSNTGANDSCQKYLGEKVAADLRSGRSENDFWKALLDSGAINIDKITYLNTAVILVNYQGNRIS